MPLSGNATGALTGPRTSTSKVVATSAAVSRSERLTRWATSSATDGSTWFSARCRSASRASTLSTRARYSRSGSFTSPGTGEGGAARSSSNDAEVNIRTTPPSPARA